MTLGASAGGLTVLAVACVVLFIIFGRKILKGALKVAAFLFLIYLAYLWSDIWLPWWNVAWGIGEDILHTAMRGPQ